MLTTNKMALNNLATTIYTVVGLFLYFKVVGSCNLYAYKGYNLYYFDFQ